MGDFGEFEGEVLEEAAVVSVVQVFFDVFDGAVERMVSTVQNPDDAIDLFDFRVHEHVS